MTLESGFSRCQNIHHVLTRVCIQNLYVYQFLRARENCFRGHLILIGLMSGAYCYWSPYSLLHLRAGRFTDGYLTGWMNWWIVCHQVSQVWHRTVSVCKQETEGIHRCRIVIIMILMLDRSDKDGINHRKTGVNNSFCLEFSTHQTRRWIIVLEKWKWFSFFNRRQFIEK